MNQDNSNSEEKKRKNILFNKSNLLLCAVAFIIGIFVSRAYDNFFPSQKSTEAPDALEQKSTEGSDALEQAMAGVEAAEKDTAPKSGRITSELDVAGAAAAAKMEEEAEKGNLNTALLLASPSSKYDETDRKKYFKLAEKIMHNAQYEFAIYYLVYGNAMQKKRAWNTIDMIANSAECSDTTVCSDNRKFWDHPIACGKHEAMARRYYRDLFNDLASNKCTWQSIMNDSKYKNTFIVSATKDAESQFLLGYTYLNAYARLKNLLELSAELDKFIPKVTAKERAAQLALAKSAVPWEKVRDLGIIIYRGKHRMEYRSPVDTDDGLCQGMTIPGTTFKVEDCYIDAILNPDMPFDVWGEYWLKSASAKGHKDAGAVLELWNKYRKKK